MAVAKAEILETIGNMSVLEIVDLISAHQRLRARCGALLKDRS